MSALRRALIAASLSLALAVSVAGTAWAEGFTISISSPTSGAVLTGTAAVRVDYTVQQETPSGAAFQLGSWSEGSQTPLSASGSGFSGSFDTRQYANGEHTLVARAWGGDYDPADPESYAQASTTIRINNAPPTPSGLSASVSGGTATVTWTPIDTQDRSDFAGYKVYRASAPSGSCPSLGSFSLRTTVTTNSFSEGGVTSTHCYAVVANRTSPQTGTISSDFSSPVVAAADGGSGGGDGGDGGTGGNGGNGGNGGGNGGDGDGKGGPVDYVRYGRSGRGGAPAAPEAPQIAQFIPTNDGTFDENLPYDPVSVTEFEQMINEGVGLSDGLAGSADSRHKAMTLVAAGLLLGVSAMQIRRFVSAP